MPGSLHQTILCLVLSAAIVAGSAPAGVWDSFNFAPDSKTVSPVSIREAVGDVSFTNASDGSPNSIILSSNGAYAALDFGKEVGGLITLSFANTTDSSAISLSFTESPLFIRPDFSDDSTYPATNLSYDGVQPVSAPLPNGTWTQDARWLRGGFRFLTLVSTSDSAVTISNVTCAISFMPHVDDLRDYAGYFYSSDPISHDADFLTKLWYAGAYTVQTNTVPLDTGRQIPVVKPPGWANNATLGLEGPIIVDGAKRDRAVWPGDMGIAVPTQFVSTNDLLPTKNALNTMFAAQNPTTGALPESGPPLSQLGSDTYHMWSMIGVMNAFLYDGDINFLENLWSNYTFAMAYMQSKVDSSGLVNITGLRDWARQGGGGHNAEGNALYYKVLVNSATLATWLNKTDQAEAWAQNATIFKQTFNDAFWLEDIGMYRDNTSTTLAPQDANSMAILFNLTASAEQADSVSAGLEKNWNEYGAVAPELPDTISPFIGGLELQAHFESGNDARAMELLRREWGYMLYTNLSVESTLLEGYTGNGSLYYRYYQGYNDDAAYTSHAHGWSSAPTSALTFYVLGLSVTTPQGATWSLAPHLSGLPSAEGGFTTPLGWFGASWKNDDSVLSLNTTTPAGTTGTLIWPVSGEAIVDGELRGSVEERTSISLDGGEHSIVITVA
ncbi:unnamed protein product [Peniophora sp. CBMAI 1063]|nr:unnamed protein product [Peniophora sp. CBMAI 1063]